MLNKSRSMTSIARRPLSSAVAAALIAGMAANAPAAGPAGVQRAGGDLVLSEGRGQLVNLASPITDVFVSNEAVADVQVRSPTQVYVFGKKQGEATVFATTSRGTVAYSANVRVGTNLGSIDQMLRLAMPDAAIRATTMNGLTLLTGTIGSPEDGAEAERLAQAFLGKDMTVVSRLRTATPLQVNLQVKIAEVSRSLSKAIGVNLLTRDTTDGFQFNVAQGRPFTGIAAADLSKLPKLDASSVYGYPAGTLSLPFDPKTQQFVLEGATKADFAGLALGSGKTALGFLGKLFGVDVASAIDLAENNGLVTILAEPNLTALSGETASFLAGGEFPIPVSQEIGRISIEYKQFGVSLAFTPTVLADGRISMRVRPEVSQLSTEGAVTLNGFSVPALTVRRAETTVELGSGQSFMIGGLLQNNNVNSIDKAPGLGDVPVLGALFRSNSYRRSQTELMIIVTPFLVKPVSANSIALPTDGLRTPTDLQTFLLGQDFGGRSGVSRPKPVIAPPITVQGGSGSVATPRADGASKRSTAPASGAVPGFSGN